MLILEDIKKRLRDNKLHNYGVSSRTTERDGKHYIQVSYYLRLPNQVHSEAVLNKCQDRAFVFIRSHDSGIFTIAKQGSNIVTSILTPNMEYRPSKVFTAGNGVSISSTYKYTSKDNKVQSVVPYKRKSSIMPVYERGLFDEGPHFELDCKSKTLHVIKEYELMYFLTAEHGNYWGLMSSEWDKIFLEIRTAIIASKAAKLSSDWDDLTNNKKIYHKKASKGFDEYYVLNQDVQKSDNLRIAEAYREAEKSETYPF